MPKPGTYRNDIKRPRNISGRAIKASSPTKKVCANCGKTITRGKESMLNDGKYYGPECVKKILDRMNAE